MLKYANVARGRNPCTHLHDAAFLIARNSSFLLFLSRDQLFCILQSFLSLKCVQCTLSFSVLSLKCVQCTLKLFLFQSFPLNASSAPWPATPAARTGPSRRRSATPQTTSASSSRSTRDQVSYESLRYIEAGKEKENSQIVNRSFHHQSQIQVAPFFSLYKKARFRQEIF